MPGSVAIGDFGKSLEYRVDTVTLVIERLPATLELTFASLCFAVAVAVRLGGMGLELSIGLVVGLVAGYAPG